MSNNTQIIVQDLPVNKDNAQNPSSAPSSAIDEDFLRQLFQDHNVLNTPDAVIIKTKISRNGTPYAYAFIKFEKYEDAVKAINDLNYTKLDNVPIRLTLADKETKSIVRSNQGNLFIKNLDPDIEVSQLHDAFANFGEIISCKIPSDLVVKGDEKKYVSRGYGYVQFRNPEDAKQAQTDLKDASINGRPVEIQPFCRRQHQNPETTFQNCYIKNFPESYKDNDLKKLFEEFGTPESYKVMTDQNGKSKQFGFCSMKTHEEAVKAVEGLNGREIQGFTLVCGRAMPRLERIKELEKLSEKWRKANYEKYKGRNLYVRNFDDTVTDEDLKHIFEQFGEIESYTVMREKDGTSRKFGFVCFKTAEDAKKCIKDSTLIQIHDKQCYVAMSMSRDQRLKANISKQQRRYNNTPQANAALNTMPMTIPFMQPQFCPACGNPMCQHQMCASNKGQQPFPQPNAANIQAPPMPFTPGNSLQGQPQQMPFKPPMNQEQPNTTENPMMPPMPFMAPMYQGMEAQPFNTFPYQQLDNKSMLRSEIMERHPQNPTLLQRLRDMSEEQANELANNQELFTQWLEQQ